MKPPRYVMAVHSKGRTYYYLRLPPRYGIPRTRLPDDPVAAAAAVSRLLGRSYESIPVDVYVQHLLASSKQRAQSKSYKHSLTAMDLSIMLAVQDYKCAVSGLQFSMDGGRADPFLRAFAPSIDRIDSSLGYAPENCRLVCRIVNFAMGKWGYDPLRTVAIAIAAMEGRGSEKGVDREHETS